MTPETKKVILSALSQHLGDNHVRARMAFSHYTPDEMQRQHGQSGETRQAILDGYEEHARAVNAAIEEVKRA